MPDKQKKSRLDIYIQIKKKHPEMPPTFGLEGLIERMLRIGPGMSGAMGIVPLDFKEIAAWDKLNILSVNEREIIRDLSRAYVYQSNISNVYGCPAPWVKDVEDIEAHNLNKKMAEITKATKNTKKLSNTKRG